MQLQVKLSQTICNLFLIFFLLSFSIYVGQSSFQLVLSVLRMTLRDCFFNKMGRFSYGVQLRRMNWSARARPGCVLWRSRMLLVNTDQDLRETGRVPSSAGPARTRPCCVLWRSRMLLVNTDQGLKETGRVPSSAGPPRARPCSVLWRSRMLLVNTDQDLRETGRVP
jgi:hypothetical protein